MTFRLTIPLDELRAGRPDGDDEQYGVEYSDGRGGWYRPDDTQPTPGTHTGDGRLRSDS